MCRLDELPYNLLSSLGLCPTGTTKSDYKHDEIIYIYIKLELYQLYEVINIIDSLKTGDSAGKDDLFRLIKSVADERFPPSGSCHYVSFEEGMFPLVLTASVVKSLYKQGSAVDSNRPISITSTFEKYLWLDYILSL